MPSITQNSTFLSNVNGASYTVTSNTTLQTTSSNYLGGSEQITSSVWTNISFGGFSDLIGITLVNDPTTTSASVVAIASGSAGQGVFATLVPGMSANIGWSGSYNNGNGVYAKVVGGWPTGTSTPQIANIKWQVQQS